MVALVESTTCQTIATVPQVYELVGDDVVRRWERLGDMDSKIHWQYGAEADALISEGVPSMLVYKAIAIKVGKSSQVIRKAYYTYKAFTKEMRDKYELCPYSVFQIARTHEQPEAVLIDYIENNASVDEIEVKYPVVTDKDIEAEFTQRGYSRMFYGVYREIYFLDPFLKDRCEDCIREIEAILKEANK